MPDCDVRVLITVSDGYTTLGDLKWPKAITDNSIWILYLSFLSSPYKFLSSKVFRFKILLCLKKFLSKKKNKKIIFVKNKQKPKNPKHR